MSVNEAVDFISKLPDELLSVIISLLPGAEPVRTSVLSKKWRTMWKHASHLNIDQSLVMKPFIQPCNFTVIYHHRRLPMSFITTDEISKAEMVMDSLFYSHVGPLNSCTIRHLPQSCASGKVFEWIKKLLEKNKVKKLSMECAVIIDKTNLQFWPQVQMNKQKMTLELPFQIFSRFETLELNNYDLNVSSPSKHVSGNVLRTLIFKNMTVEKCAWEKVLSYCFSLENLTLENVCYDGGKMTEVMINSPILKFFKICGMAINEIKVSAVNLEVFEIDSVVMGQNLTFEFDIPKVCVLRSCPDMVIREQYICLVRSKLLHLKKIPQTGESNHSPQHSTSSFAGIFENLDTLCIHYNLKTVRNSMALLSALKSCPNLQNLEINSQVNCNDQVDEDDAKLYYKSRTERCECIDHHLKTLSIKGLAGEQSEVEFLKYILTSGKLMKKITVWFVDDCSWVQVTEVRCLQSFVKASPNLSIILNPGPKHMATVDNGNFETWLSTLKN